MKKSEQLLTLKHPLVIINVANIVLVAVIFLFIVLPYALKGDWIWILTTVLSAIFIYGSVSAYINRKKFNFFDNAETIASRQNFGKHSGIHLLIFSYMCGILLLIFNFFVLQILFV